MKLTLLTLAIAWVAVGGELLCSMRSKWLLDLTSSSNINVHSGSPYHSWNGECGIGRSVGEL